jgi:hypothetical protein
VGPYSVFTAATVLATLAVMCNTVLVAQTSKEWSQCTGGDGPIADVIISGCSAVIQAGQDNPKRLATAFNNRGVGSPYSITSSARLEMQGHVQAERLGGFEIERQYVLGRCLHWQVRRLLALEDAIDVTGGEPVRPDRIGTVRDQAAAVTKKRNE